MFTVIPEDMLSDIQVLLSSREVLVPCRSSFPWTCCTRALRHPKAAQMAAHPYLLRDESTLRLSLPQLVLKAVFKRSQRAYAGAEFKSSLGKGGEGTRGSTDCLSQLHTSSQIDLANLITDTTNSRLTPD